MSGRPAPFTDKLAWLDRFRGLLTTLAIAFILFAAFISLSWHYNSLERLVPHWIGRLIYPIDKTNIDILRFMHFLAVAWLVRLAVRSTLPACAGRSGSHFADAARHRYLYSVSVLSWR
jgi:ABC-type phosphate/phosphonate transport system permease subunit